MDRRSLLTAAAIAPFVSVSAIAAAAPSASEYASQIIPPDIAENLPCIWWSHPLKRAMTYPKMLGDEIALRIDFTRDGVQLNECYGKIISYEKMRSRIWPQMRADYEVAVVELFNSKIGTDLYPYDFYDDNLYASGLVRCNNCGPAMTILRSPRRAGCHHCGWYVGAAIHTAWFPNTCLQPA